MILVLDRVKHIKRPDKRAASVAKNVEYDININIAVYRFGISLILVNLVNNAFMQPTNAPIAREPRKMPRKLPNAWNNCPMSKFSELLPNFSTCLWEKQLYSHLIKWKKIWQYYIYSDKIIETASFKTLSPNTSAYKSESRFCSLKIANVVTRIY